MSTVTIKNKKCVCVDTKDVVVNGHKFIEMTYKSISDGEEFKMRVEEIEPTV